MHDVLRIGGQYKATAMKKAVEVGFQHVRICNQPSKLNFSFAILRPTL